MDLPPPESIRQLAGEIVRRPAYDLGSPDSNAIPIILRVIRALVHFFGPLFGWLPRLWDYSPLLAALVLLTLFGVLIALVVHIIYSVRMAMRVPESVRALKLSDSEKWSPAALEQRAREAAARGDFIEAVRQLFLASLLTLENAQQRTVRRGATNREYLQRFKSSAAFEPLKLFVAILDSKWYAGAPCTDADFHECQRAYTQIQHSARSAARGNERELQIVQSA